MKDVAERAGVSVMTVSLVLSHNEAGSRISPETRSRVLEAAKALRYLPNARGRALRSGVTNIIGLYAGHGFVDVRLGFFTEVVSGLQLGCEQYRKDLLLHGNFRGNTTEDIYIELADGRIDGLVVNMPPNDPLAERLARSNFPVVAVADPLPNIPSITVDDAAGSRLLAEYLAGRGHRRLLYLGSAVHPVSTIRRRAAFLEAGHDLNLQVDLLDFSDGIKADDDFISDLLARPSECRPTAVVCWNDATAYDLLAKCYRRQVRVPEELAIVGFDGYPTPLSGVQSLTTIRAPWAEAGRTAVQTLHDLLSGRPAPPETMLPVMFAQGHTA